MDLDFNQMKLLREAYRLTVAATKNADCRFLDTRIGRKESRHEPCRWTKPLTEEGLVRIYSAMSVAPADIRSLHGHVQLPPRDRAALRALRFTFALFTSRRPPRR